VGNDQVIASDGASDLDGCFGIILKFLINS
jgi:hypothetical protein